METAEHIVLAPMLSYRVANQLFTANGLLLVAQARVTAAHYHTFRILLHLILIVYC